MTVARLRAKSWRGNSGDRQDAPDAPESIYLLQHLQDVLASADAVLNATGVAQLNALTLPLDQWLPRLRAVVRFAAAVHDLGKANDQFQAMVSNPGGRHPQILRHEWITYWLFQQNGWREWSQGLVGSEEDWRVGLWTIAGHHPAHGHPSPPERVEGAGVRAVLLARHAEFHDILSWLSCTFSGAQAPQADQMTISNGGAVSDIDRLRKAVSEVQRTCWNGTPFDGPMRRFVAACKACLIAADVAGSAMPRVVTRQGERVRRVMTTLAVAPDPTDLEGLVHERLRQHAPRPFQASVAASSSRVTLVRAGCGTGKTVAAYLWAARRHPRRRLYFCYPTTGTATEGFRGYLFDSESRTTRFDAALFHSRADIDREIILGGADTDGDDDILRVESLRAWSTPIAVCTVDTVLGLLNNHRRGLFAWPALAQAAFVFDEIHAYDRTLFGLLLRFLKTFAGVPVLLMTASLPRAHLAALHETLGAANESLAIVEGPAELEQRSRYHRFQAANTLQAVRAELVRGGKVLWICNTVTRALAAANAARSLGLAPLLYHSRFRYEDRVARHKDVMDAFEQEGAALAICTQVAEMSLDISASLLVTELAPIPALIQRLGRLNRRAESDSPAITQPFIITEPTNADGTFAALPYGTEEAEHGDWPATARAWLERLGTGGLSQADLAGAWDDIVCDGQVNAPVPAPSCWLDGGPITNVAPIRDASPGVTVLLAADARDVSAGTLSAARVALPMPPPRGHDWKAWDRVRGYLVAPEGIIDYDRMRGARWAQ